MRKYLLLLLSFCFFNAQSQDTISSLKNGRWSDVSVWAGKKLPSKNQIVLVRHNVTFDVFTDVGGLFLGDGKVLTFDKNKSCLLKTNGNIIIWGKLSINSPTVTRIHKILFYGIDSTKFLGGGMGVMDSDKGLWIDGNGVLEINGAKKTSWLNLLGEAKKDAKVITLEKTPVGWRVGDSIVIVPTNHYDSASCLDGFDLRKIVRISKNIVTLDAGLSFNHPTVKNPFTKADTHESKTLSWLLLLVSFWLVGISHQ